MQKMAIVPRIGTDDLRMIEKIFPSSFFGPSGVQEAFFWHLVIAHNFRTAHSSFANSRREKNSESFFLVCSTHVMRSELFAKKYKKWVTHFFSLRPKQCKVLSTLVPSQPPPPLFFSRICQNVKNYILCPSGICFMFVESLSLSHAYVGFADSFCTSKENQQRRKRRKRKELLCSAYLGVKSPPFIPTFEKK